VSWKIFETKVSGSVAALSEWISWVAFPGIMHEKWAHQRVDAKKNTATNQSCLLFPSRVLHYKHTKCQRHLYDFYGFFGRNRLKTTQMTLATAWQTTPRWRRRHQQRRPWFWYDGRLLLLLQYLTILTLIHPRKLSLRDGEHEIASITNHEQGLASWRFGTNSLRQKEQVQSSVIVQL